MVEQYKSESVHEIYTRLMKDPIQFSLWLSYVADENLVGDLVSDVTNVPYPDEDDYQKGIEMLCDRRESIKPYRDFLAKYAVNQHETFQY